MAPGVSATALVALAMRGGRPNATAAGNERSDPPPATALTMPAAMEAQASTATWVLVMASRLVTPENGRCQPRRRRVRSPGAVVVWGRAPIVSGVLREPP